MDVSIAALNPGKKFKLRKERVEISVKLRGLLSMGNVPRGKILSEDVLSALRADFRFFGDMLFTSACFMRRWRVRGFS
jgi:hypothetical protein